MIMLTIVVVVIIGVVSISRLSYGHRRIPSSNYLGGRDQERLFLFQQEGRSCVGRPLPHFILGRKSHLHRIAPGGFRRFLRVLRLLVSAGTNG